MYQQGVYLEASPAVVMALEQIRISAWAIWLLLLLSQASANSVTENHNPSPLNYIKGINETDSGARNHSGIDWDTIFPPFEAFLNGTNDRLDVPDRDVFEFNPENIASCDLDLWYIAWTRKWSSHSLWSRGETNLWAYLFLGTGDYFCDISATHCTHEADSDKIQMLWPGPENRALAQRIYLHQYMLSLNHNMKRQQLDAFKSSHAYLSNYAFDMVKTFTKQVDEKQVMACDIIHKTVDIALQVAVSMAAGAAGALSNALTAQNSLLSKLASINVLDGKQFSNKGIQWAKGMLKTGTRNDWSEAAKFDWLGVIQSQFTSTTADFAQKYSHNIVTVNEGKNITKHNRPELDPGVAADFMCSAFEGDRKDLNEANTHELNKIMAEFFSEVGNKMQNLFTKSYNGWIHEEGMPSMLAIDFATQDWLPLYGPNSEHHPLKNPVAYEGAIMTRVLKHLLSRIASDDNIYLYCLHVDDALEQCRTIPKKDDPQWYKDYRSTQICPRPDTDPKLLCSAARWYHTSTMQSHVSAMPGIDKIEGWSGGKFGLTVKGLLQESYEAYVLYRNNLDKIDWTSEDLEGPVFGLPTCVSDALHLHDMNPVHGLPIWKNPSHIQFPFTCGDWRANESADFMKAMNLEPGSKIHERIEGISGTFHPNELFEDRIPRLLDERNTSAVSHYLNLCANGIRLPEKKDKKGDSFAISQWRIHTELDRDCGLIQGATANMTEFDANLWFCENRGNHTIFQRQQDHHLVPETQWNFDSHKKRCDKWLKDLHKKENRAKSKEKKKLGW